MAINPIVTSAVSDIMVAYNAPDTTVNLLSYFDDPSTTGLVAQFKLYDTTLGNGITNVVLFDQADAGAPLTVQNFLNYVNDGDYVNTIIHRSIEDFVIQGGGFTMNNLNYSQISTDAPVENEFSTDRSNVRGTIAMAKLGSDPDSATSQWFFNLADNSENLDNQNGGFTVFGQVLSESDLGTIDAIAALQTYDGSSLNSAFSNIPLTLNNTNNTQLDEDNDFVRYQSITVSQLDELEFTVINNTNPSLANITFNGSTLQIDYLPNQVGTAEITLRGTNLFGLSVDDTFSLTVLLDPVQYGASNTDLLPIFGNNLEALTAHYYTYGQAEGRNVDTFDERRYLASHDDLLTVFGNDLALATEHYISYGYFEKRSVDSFNPSQYLASYDDLILTLGNNPQAATPHFINFGFNEGRLRDNFKEDIYLASHGDLIQAFGYNLEAATQHYLNYGVHEGRGKEIFDPVAYLQKNSDLQTFFGNDTTLATWHYINYGYAEGRIH